MRIGLSKRHIYSLPALEAAWDTAGWGGETDRTRYGCGATESSWLGQNPPPVSDESPYHSSTWKKANGMRKVVITPD